MQVAILSDITKSQKYDKVKVAKKQAMHPASPNWPCRYCGSSHALRKCPIYGKMCANYGKMGHFKKVCWSRKDHTVHEVGVEMAQEEGVREESINSVYLNNKWSLITAKLEMHIGNNTL